MNYLLAFLDANNEDGGFHAAHVQLALGRRQSAGEQTVTA